MPTPPCDSFRRDLHAFLDGEVSVDRNLEVLEHLEECDPCAVLAAAEKRFEERFVATLRDEPPPPGLSQRLDGAVDRAAAALAAERRSGPTMNRRLQRVLPAAAAAAILAVGAAWLTCTGPFQCAAIKGAVEVAVAMESGTTPLTVLGHDPEEVAAALAAGGAGRVPTPDLAELGYRLVGGAARVPAGSLGGSGGGVEYRSSTGRVAVVDVPFDHRPRRWNRVEDADGTWFRAEWREHRVVGWLADGSFRAVVGTASEGDLLPVARRVRTAPR